MELVLVVTVVAALAILAMILGAFALAGACKVRTAARIFLVLVIGVPLLGVSVLIGQMQIAQQQAREVVAQRKAIEAQKRADAAQQEAQRIVDEKAQASAKAERETKEKIEAEARLADERKLVTARVEEQQKRDREYASRNRSLTEVLNAERAGGVTVERTVRMPNYHGSEPSCEDHRQAYQRMVPTPKISFSALYPECAGKN